MSDGSNTPRAILIAIAVTAFGVVLASFLQGLKDQKDADKPPLPLIHQPAPPGTDAPGTHGTDHVVQNPSTKTRLVHAARFIVDDVKPPGIWAGEGISTDRIVFHGGDFDRRSNSYYKRVTPIKIAPNDDAVNIRVYVVDRNRGGFLYSGRMIFYYGEPRKPGEISFPSVTIAVSSADPR